jgi:hypothetical protein
VATDVADDVRLLSRPLIPIWQRAGAQAIDALVDHGRVAASAEPDVWRAALPPADNGVPRLVDTDSAASAIAVDARAGRSPPSP